MLTYTDYLKLVEQINLFLNGVALSKSITKEEKDRIRKTGLKLRKEVCKLGLAKHPTNSLIQKPFSKFV